MQLCGVGVLADAIVVAVLVVSLGDVVIVVDVVVV